MSKSKSKSSIVSANQRFINISVVSWTQLVSFYDGFEAIMNHLEKEFSKENLLFIQEVKGHNYIITTVIHSGVVRLLLGFCFV